MGRRKVILHVGQSKAGSTSIQNYLEAQRKQLSEKGFLFPRSGFSRKNPFDPARTSGHLGLVRSIVKGQLHEFEEELNIDPESTLILSVENLFSEQPDHVLDRVADYFEDWDVHIVTVLREQTAWLRSRYVENVMSGFASRFESFSTFVAETSQRGVLKYNARLDFLRERLRAQSSFTINFESTDRALVPRFLDAVGIPITDPNAAFEVHDNRREKPVFLIEAKRRLNILTNSLGLEARLELEHALRERGKAMLLDGAPDQTVNEFELSLTRGERLELEHDNRLLSKQKGVDQALELDKSAGNLSKEAMSRISAAADDLFWFGLEHASRLVVPAPKIDTAPLASLSLYSGASDRCREALSNARVSVHIGVPETAILAACKERRIVRLFLEESQEAYEIAAYLDTLPLPSHALTLVVKDLSAHNVHSLTQAYSLPAPDLVVKEGVEAQLSSINASEGQFELHSILNHSRMGSAFALYRIGLGFSNG